MIIIGAGRIGGALARAASLRGEPCALVSRTAGHEALTDGSEGPILLAVRNDALDAVLAQVPAARRGELVLVQNGMLRPWISDQNLLVTRGLLFFAVASQGAPIQPGLPSPFTGPEADAVVDWLTRVGIDAVTVSADAFAEVELEKLIWNCAFGLLSQCFDVPVDGVVLAHGDVLAQLVGEFVAVGRASLGVDLSVAPLLSRLNQYSLSIAGYRGEVKEWPWRNGWFVESAHRLGVPTPQHDLLLRAVGR